jgi:hypothetical protein
MTVALIDNRVALTDEPADALPEFYPPYFNGTVVPRSLGSFSAAMEFPLPGTVEWGRLNRRRGELIRRKVRGSLSREEDQELAWLQRETLSAVDRLFPRPPVDPRALEELEMRLRKGPSQETP